MDLDGQRAVVDAFLAAARGGDFDALVAVLDPDVLLRADAGAISAMSREVHGAESVASGAITFSRRDLEVHPALINGVAGVVATRDGRPFSVMACTVRRGRIVELNILADAERLAALDLTILAG